MTEKIEKENESLKHAEMQRLGIYLNKYDVKCYGKNIHIKHENIITQNK